VISIYISTIVYLKLNSKYADTYGIRIQIYQLIFSVVLLVISFWLLTKDILLSPFLIILGVVVSGSYFEYYDEVLHYIKRMKIFKTIKNE
jgi:hypothetical protein